MLATPSTKMLINSFVGTALAVLISTWIKLKGILSTLSSPGILNPALPIKQLVIWGGQSCHLAYTLVSLCKYINRHEDNGIDTCIIIISSGADTSPTQGSCWPIIDKVYILFYHMLTLTLLPDLFCSFSSFSSSSLILLISGMVIFMLLT